MSSYVDALERWNEDAPRREEESGRAGAGTASFDRVCARLDREADAGGAVAIVGVHRHDRAADVARGCAERFVAEGKRVLLVDLDPEGRVGESGTALETLLAEDRAPESDAGAALTVVTSEPRFEGRPRSFEDALWRWLDAQRPRFDRVVVHAGAVSESALAASVAGRGAAVAVVVRARWTGRGDLRRACERLARERAAVVGAVLVGGASLPGWLERLLQPFAASYE